MNAKKIISICFVMLLCFTTLADTNARKRIVLQKRDLPINRELTLDPEVWYDTDERVMDVFMNSTGRLTVYYEDGVTVYNVVNLSFDLNRVFCDKGCNLIILETADGVVYEGYLQGEVDVK